MILAHIKTNTISADNLTAEANLPVEQEPKQEVPSLQDTFIGLALKKSAFGNNRKLPKTVVEQFAETAHADAKSLKASKTLIDNCPAFDECKAIQSDAYRYWRDATAPHLDAGVRLARKDQLMTIDNRLADYRSALESAKLKLSYEIDAIREEAKTRLADLYEPGDYPHDIADEFNLEWEVREISINDDWKDLAPEVYAAQVAAAEAKLAVCVKEAETEFAEQLADAVGKIVNNLQGNEDGSLKGFGKANLERIRTAIDRFKSLNITNSAKLNEVFEQAEAAVQGKTVEGLKANVLIQDELKASMGKLADTLNEMAEVRPARKIKIKKKEEPQTQAA